MSPQKYPTSSVSFESQETRQQAKVMVLAQRRRWLNGSLFAAVYTVVHFWKIWQSGHGFIRKCMLQVEVVYQVISMIFAWFALVSVSVTETVNALLRAKWTDSHRATFTWFLKSLWARWVTQLY